MTGTPDREALWQATYAARRQHFESTVGPLPEDIIKLLSMTGVWPGGGLFVIPAAGLGASLAVYTSFGLTNPDMPATVRMTGFQLEPDGQGGTQASGRLQKKAPAPARPGAAGYGYEIMVVAQQDQQWPLMLLQWAVAAEIEHDVGLLARVEQYDGVTVEQINVGPGGPVNVLISKACAPLPGPADLPAGTMELLVATTITDQEMRWAMTSGCGALLPLLRAGGVGQISNPERTSVAL